MDERDLTIAEQHAKVQSAADNFIERISYNLGLRLALVHASNVTVRIRAVSLTQVMLFYLFYGRVELVLGFKSRLLLVSLTRVWG